MSSGIHLSAANPSRTQLHVHVIDSLRVGGAQTQLVTMLREVAGMPGTSHCVITLFGDGELSGAIRDLGIPVHVLNLEVHLSQRRFCRAARELQRLFQQLRPDLVEAHLTFSRILGLYAAWRCSVPKRIGFEQGDLYLDSWKFRAANFIVQWFAQRIVVCSDALREWAHKTHGIVRSKLVVLHNCVDPFRFAPDGPSATDIRFPDQGTVFAAVGTLGRGVDKRVDVCIRSLAAARNAGARVSLVICGDGMQRPELEKLAQELGVVHHVMFLGTRFDVSAVLRSCDAFCHAAPWEPFGIVAIEAMAVGIPVIVPDSGGIREILRNGEGGFLYPPLDHEALAGMMIKLAADAKLRQSMGLAARRVVEKNFSVRQYVKRLYGVYGLDCSHATKVAPAEAPARTLVGGSFPANQSLLP